MKIQHTRWSSNCSTTDSQIVGLVTTGSIRIDDEGDSIDEIKLEWMLRQDDDSGTFEKEQQTDLLLDFLHKAKQLSAALILLDCEEKIDSVLMRHVCMRFFSST